VLVRAVEDSSAAAAAGVERGDLIVAANGRAVAAVDDLYEALDGADPDRALELGLLRGNEEKSVKVSFEQRQEAGR
jgi:S1-C subfamily serine protease